ncbi:MAG: glycosyltransferase family 9 protein [Pseudomonadota bacterium]
MISPDKKGRPILVVVRGALGDAVITLPLLTALAIEFESERLFLAGNPVNLSVLAGLPFTAGILDHDRAEWSGLYQNPPLVPERLGDFLLSLEAAVVLAPGPEDALADGLKALGLKKVLLAPSRPDPDRGIHLSERQWSSLGLPRPKNVPLLAPSAEGLAGAREFLEKNRLLGRPVASFHPGSGAARKNWPLAGWLRLARLARDRMGLTPLFILGPADQALAAELAAEAPGLVTARDLSLDVLAGLLAPAAIHSGNDSGVSHLAAALGVPVLAVFGPADPAHWAPRGPRVKIVAPPGPCSLEGPLLRPSYEEVRQAWLELFAAGHPAAP